MSDTTTSDKPKRRWTRYLLVGSLALNLLILGVIAGAAVRGPGPWMGQRMGGAGNIFGYVSSLPPERRNELTKRGAVMRGELRPLRQQAREANRARTDALLAEPFDRQRYIDAQTRQIEAETQIRLLMRNLVADTAGGMSLAERRAFLAWRGARGGDDAEDAPPKKP
jgi:uncharacterized membrane protein